MPTVSPAYGEHTFSQARPLHSALTQGSTQRGAVLLSHTQDGASVLFKCSGRLGLALGEAAERFRDDFLANRRDLLHGGGQREKLERRHQTDRDGGVRWGKRGRSCSGGVVASRESCVRLVIGGRNGCLALVRDSRG
jgi:hypothetical protein